MKTREDYLEEKSLQGYTQSTVEMAEALCDANIARNMTEALHFATTGKTIIERSSVTEHIRKETLSHIENIKNAQDAEACYYPPFEAVSDWNSAMDQAEAEGIMIPFLAARLAEKMIDFSDYRLENAYCEFYGLKELKQFNCKGSSYVIEL